MLISLCYGALVGFALGLTGGGGSIFAVPLLIYGLGVPVHQAVVISLAAVGGTALAGAVAQLRGGAAELKTAVLFGLAGIGGAPLGAWLGAALPAATLRLGFAVLMLLLAVRLWRHARARPAETRLIRAEVATPDGTGATCRLDPAGGLRLDSRCLLMLLLAGLLTGLLAGLFGVGGGFLIVPALLLIASLPMRRAVATSLVVIAIISAAGVVSHLWAGHGLRLDITLWFVLGGLAGMGLGIAVGRRLAGPTLQRLFAALMTAVALAMLAGEALRLAA